MPANFSICRPMTEEKNDSRKDVRRDLIRQLGEKENRRLRSRRQGDRGIWFGLGMFGLVGWAVAVPTLVGTAVGVLVDSHGSGSFSWTLTGITAGIGLGCLNAWYWVHRERDKIDEERGDDV